MEGLRKLEQVQMTISFMQSLGIVNSSNHNDNSSDSNRFLADFVLLLIQPCGELNMRTKCKLISEHFSKISSLFLDEASQCLGGEDFFSFECPQIFDKKTTEAGSEQIESAVLLPCDNKADLGSLQGSEQIESAVLLPSDSKSDLVSLQGDFQGLAMIGLDAMQRANSTLEDFCRSYFMFHEMDVNRPQLIFRFLPLLSFTESYIYQLDGLNEKLSQLLAGTLPVLDRESYLDANQGLVLKFTQLFRTDPFGPLILLLENQGLLTERIKEEFGYAVEYWALERKLCCALTCKKEILTGDVIGAIHLKSFDYRVLNLLLYQLRSEKVDELHMQFLSASELLVEVCDDLFDYEDDILENNFNILRMFVRIFGASKAPAMLAKFITEAEEKYNELLKALDPELSVNYQKRCEEATKEGGKSSGALLGTWNIPHVIEDEDTYRSEYLYSAVGCTSGPTLG